METLCIYLPIPILVPKVDAAILMTLGVALFFGFDKFL